MGIQGLLPILKPIQRHKHLSEFTGQTLAVDAYVWLHRGAYACAAELVQGRPTRKYVDYCMHRVRLLRHHGIAPYIVFDGGPLPAKQGTEQEREKRRAENIKRALELSAQGKEGQAREYYVKCVDVTPQMAYQVIKALKAENVPYVVAPYEADAQLAYLERTGLVNGIITEDSDLLVFGCQNVLFKLDTVSSTIISISRSDFGSPSLASESVSLVGWSDSQFRWMAMLSGCDYLPSISGIGLKTAYQLLKKYNSVDRVVKMVRLEGKKTVPKGYIDAFYMAEKVFLHQRVYDPRLEKLVYLMSPPSDIVLSEKAELYIGRDLEASLAKRIAEGHACPITLADMEDINPSFVPKLTKALPLQSRNTNISKTPEGKGIVPKNGGLFNFFTKTPLKASLAKPTSTKKTPARAVSGNASGKRTLIDVMEHDMAIKRKKFEAEAVKGREIAQSASRFFNKQVCGNYGAGPSCGTISGHPAGSTKENLHPEGTEATGSIDEDYFDSVVQEDGYLSPSPCISRNVTPDFSSPICVQKKASRTNPVSDADSAFACDSLSSPVPTCLVQARRKLGAPTQDIPTQYSEERILVRGSPEPLQEHAPGPDLTINFGGDDVDDDDGHSDQSSEILCWDDNDGVEAFVRPTPSPNSSITLPSQAISRSDSGTTTAACEVEELLDEDSDDIIREASRAKVAQGWSLRFSFGSPMVSAKGEVAVQRTPKTSQNGRLKSTLIASAPQPNRQLSRNQSTRSSVRPRKSNPYPLNRPLFTVGSGTRNTPITLDSDDIIEEVSCATKGRLGAFR
ncbi:hypothetical protein M0805_002026 [Coniferiporia weirii]|nr:hypothetical protein M0805_002026 [Coniferiporia weirii]